MSGHKYISNSNNLFDEDDVDDDTFVNSYRSRYQPSQTAKSGQSYGGHLGELERQRQAMLERQREIEQRTIDSSIRSVGLLRDSEQIGIATAEEMVRQREQLENTNRRLDEINTNLNYSQKHLNGIKSVFDGLKNYLLGKSDQTPPRGGASPGTAKTPVPSGSGLNSTLDTMSQPTGGDRYSSHPSTKLKGLDDNKEAVGQMTDSRRVNEMLDANLDEMVTAISRLKGLGTALTSEIDQQNELLDTIQDKVEVADIKIGKQNKQMNKLLGK